MFLIYDIFVLIKNICIVIFFFFNKNKYNMKRGQINYIFLYITINKFNDDQN